MRVLFVGPSLAGSEASFGDIEIRPPAAQGDLARAVLGGASAIGLVDGMFEGVASVWHKEILFALSEGVRVLGAASMGALRAAECQPFGMEPIGVIANAYLCGELVDDAAVAVLHAPPEAGSFLLTEALVDAEATISRLLEVNAIGEWEHEALLRAARGLFFKERTPQAIVSKPANLNGTRRREILESYRNFRVSLKRSDALLLARRLELLPKGRVHCHRKWDLAVPATWTGFLSEAVESEAANTS